MACSTKQERKATIQALVNRVFTRMEAIFPRTWRASFTTGEMLQLAKRELALSMASWSSLPRQERLDMIIEEIKLEGGNWPPSIAEMCRRFKPSLEDFGLPEPEVAFREAHVHAGNVGGHTWSHEAVREAGNATGWWDLRHCANDHELRRLRKVFMAEYEALCNRILQGDTLGERVALLESDDMKSAVQLAQEAGERKAQEQADALGALPADQKQAMAKMRALLGEGGGHA